MKQQALAILLFLVLLLSTACAGPEPDPLPEPEPGPEPQPVPEDFYGLPGETLDTAFFSFCVEESRRTAEAVEGAEPPEGMEFVVVSITLSSDSQDTMVYFDEFDLVVDGIPRFPEFPWADSHLPEEALLTGPLSKELVYTVSRDAQDLELVYREYYQGDVLGNGYHVPLS